MHRTIRFATYDDIPAIMPVIDAAREMMHASIHETMGQANGMIMISISGITNNINA
jgi:hypothetical protein